MLRNDKRSISSGIGKREREKKVARGFNVLLPLEHHSVGCKTAEFREPKVGSGFPALAFSVCERESQTKIKIALSETLLFFFLSTGL